MLPLLGKQQSVGDHLEARRQKYVNDIVQQSARYRNGLSASARVKRQPADCQVRKSERVVGCRDEQESAVQGTWLSVPCKEGLRVGLDIVIRRWMRRRTTRVAGPDLYRLSREIRVVSLATTRGSIESESTRTKILCASLDWYWVCNVGDECVSLGADEVEGHGKR